MPSMCICAKGFGRGFDSTSCHLLTFVHRKSAWTKAHKEKQPADNGEGLEEVVTQEVALWVRRMNGPEVVDGNLWTC